MAHFAEIDSNNIVKRVLVIPNEQEKRGQTYLAKDLGLGGTWIQTSYNNNGVNFAGIGYEWDGEKFIPPIYPADEGVIEANETNAEAL